ncbi:hypothetical protein [Planctomycetes bacterium Pan216]
MRQIVASARKKLNPGRIGGELKVAFGIAIPCLEAWLLCGKDHGVSERAWIEAKRNNRSAPYPGQQLKQFVYGTDRPAGDVQRDRGVEEATRVASILDRLENDFPIGFGSLAKEIRSW